MGQIRYEDAFLGLIVIRTPICRWSMKIATQCTQALITTMNIILHATFVFYLKLAFSLNFLPYTYRVFKKMWLLYKMDTIFVISTPNNHSMQNL
ncbi:hypothetical protein Y032_0414g1045 [Ancylostoma ceylanicum]|nr:hypothetical protein Y032_0414g1045 [Ancylostoma ceylanicum]